MKNVSKKLVVATLFLAGIMMTILYSCSEKTPEETAGFTLSELLERDKELAYDEFLQLQTKFTNLKNQYFQDTTNFESLLKISEIYIYEARVSGEHPYYYTAALTTLEKLLSNEKILSEDQLFTSLFYKATVQLSQHNFTDALVTGKKALAINDVNSGIYGVLVDANIEIGNYDEAVKMCDKMLTIRPDLRSYSRTSYLREIYGDLPGSKKAMMMAIEAGAPYSEYKCWSMITLGNIYEGQGLIDSAQVCYKAALLERDKYPFAIAGEARVEAKKGNFKEAEKLYKQAIKIVPEIGFNISLARLKQQEGKTKEVTKMMTEIEAMFEEDIASGHNMSLEYGNFILEFKKDYKEALKYGKMELKNRPDNIDVNKLMAFSYYGLGDTKNAKTHLKKALATSKKDAELLCLEGLLNKDKNEVKNAFAMNPYQEHVFVERAQQFVN